MAGAGEAVEITQDSQWFQNGCIVIRPENTEAGISVENLERAQGVPVYEGTLEVYQGSNGLVLVNELPLETYLKYVVPSEMPASYAQEALKAQAVCARTYAYRQMLNNSLSDYHAQVDDSVSYQVYNNTQRQDSTDQAVDATAGKILTCGGEPITAYFSPPPAVIPAQMRCGIPAVMKHIWRVFISERMRRRISVRRKRLQVLLRRRMRIVMKRRTDGTAGR